MTFHQELLLLSSRPCTIHSEGWIVDWVDRARDIEIKDGWFWSFQRFDSTLIVKLNPEHSAAAGLMVSLVGLTIKITGAEIPGFDLKVQFDLMQMQMI